MLLPVIARALASYEGEGSIAMFNYAIRLVEFPLAIAVTFVAVILFPRMAQSFTADPVLHRKLIRYGVQITLGLSLVASITLMSLSDVYTEIVYGHGSMQNSSLVSVAALTTIGLFALPLQGFSSFLTAVFNARKDTRTPLLLNGAGLVFFLLISKADIFGQGLHALMWGMVASYGLICVLQMMFIKIGSFSWRQILLDRWFLAGAICAASLSAYVSRLISQAGLSAWLSLLLACFVAPVSLAVMALFNGELRSFLKTRLSTK